MKWYRASNWEWELNILPVEVIKETKEFITIKDDPLYYKREHRVRKKSNRDTYFRTLEEAIKFKRSQLVSNILRAGKKLQNARGLLNKFNSLYPETNHEVNENPN